MTASIIMVLCMFVAGSGAGYIVGYLRGSFVWRARCRRAELSVRSGAEASHGC
jgi:hypothetical protein